ncbi:VOC family protein [Acuticoccus sp. M5D2P5]|uniref:VOC family protein n=1 Tax=Acuticoccus kalidii TaxID=2910977 RepID=UPI001F359B98|nr:VOC family protein [Acuticoccus kalidii]MCF3932153.1 VOC family protein [Acuticoccus kalidii]
MTHKSRLGTICIDCKTDDLPAALAYWSAALGRPGKLDPGGKYAEIAPVEGEPIVILQAVDHDSRVHLDIETDDKAAEVARLEALGAKVVAEIQTWIVMEAPTGHRFCVVNPQRADFAEKAPPAGGETAG